MARKNKNLSPYQFGPRENSPTPGGGQIAEEGEDCHDGHLDEDGYCDAVGCDNYGHTL